jgi:hypothetical protein
MAATTGSLTILRLVYLQGAALEVSPIEPLHGAGRVGVGHLHEAEAARPSGFAIGYQRDLFNGSVLREEGAYGIIGRGEGKISNV